LNCRVSVLAAAVLMVAGIGLISCGASANPDIGRVLTGISVTPQAADAQNSPNGQVVFTATGTFSLPPTPAPVSFVSPYTGQFFVDNSGNVIANVVTTGSGTVTVQCAAGATGTVAIVASASANNGTTTVVSGSAQLTCP